MFLLFSADFGDKYKSELVLVHTITRKSVKRKKKPIFEPIFGLAVLDKELFVMVEDNSEVEVYNSTKLSLSRRWGLDEPQQIYHRSTTTNSSLSKTANPKIGSKIGFFFLFTDFLVIV